MQNRLCEAAIQAVQILSNPLQSQEELALVSNYQQTMTKEWTMRMKNLSASAEAGSKAGLTKSLIAAAPV